MRRYEGRRATDAEAALRAAQTSIYDHLASHSLETAQRLRARRSQADRIAVAGLLAVGAGAIVLSLLIVAGVLPNAVSSTAMFVALALVVAVLVVRAFLLSKAASDADEAVRIIRAMERQGVAELRLLEAEARDAHNSESRRRG